MGNVGPPRKPPLDKRSPGIDRLPSLKLCTMSHHQQPDTFPTRATPADDNSHLPRVETPHSENATSLDAEQPHGVSEKAGKLLTNTAPKEGDLGARWLATYDGPRPELTAERNNHVRNKIDTYLLPVIFLIYFNQQMVRPGFGLVRARDSSELTMPGQVQCRVLCCIWLQERCESPGLQLFHAHHYHLHRTARLPAA